ncbi:MAG TPA: PIN domain-containing protein [Candidatus Bathyarchaeota archaeon]|nr:PIN domain-containing protein [Candidatus Bathyarchaeota archaeon]
MYVVDASIYASVIVKDQFSQKSRKFLEENIGSLLTLDLAIVETANALWKHTFLLKRIPESTSRKLAKSINPLIENTSKIYPSKNLIGDALQVAFRYGITVYDALYLALAFNMNCPLTTLDESLSKKLRDKVSNIRLLA